MQRICLVEDISDLQAIIKLAFEGLYQVDVAGTLAEARSLLENNTFDLILLDVNLPDGNGFEFCKALRQSPKTAETPIIFLTGKSEPVDKLLGFSIGADDYMAKPFEPIELRARIQARLKKRRPAQDAMVTQQIGPLKLDKNRQRITRVDDSGEQDLGLTPFEFRIVQFLVSQAETAFSRAELLKNVGERNVHVNDENIYTHISSIRRKLGDAAEFLECIPRVGYRFTLSGKKKPA